MSLSGIERRQAVSAEEFSGGKCEAREFHRQGTGRDSFDSYDSPDKEFEDL